MAKHSSELISNWIKEIQAEFSADSQFCILHVDDEKDLREIFADVMSEIGIKLISATNGVEALQILKERSHDITMIFSDIKMPEMDGFALRNAALKDYEQIPFCIISSHVDREMALRGVELKIVAFLSKPFEVDSLAEVFHKEALPKIKALKEDRELKQGFIAECQELMEESEEILLRLERDNSDTEALNRFYAIMHTLKGASAFFDPKDMHRFVHAYEDILKKLQKSELSFSASVTAVLFKGFDVIKGLYGEFSTGKHLPHDFQALLAVLDTNAAKEAVALDSTQSGDRESSSHDTDSKKDAIAVHAKSQSTEDIKVSVKLLDEFMQLSGEVTVVRNMLNKCVSSIERRFAGDRDVGMLTELLSELHKINSGVQTKMAEIRKVPLKSVAKVLPRAVRDVAKSLKKKVDLQITGDELRIDASIAEVLSNSLLHVIKNSLDHGIESPEARMNAGKPEAGVIQVDACIRDEKVIVRIADDGNGINVEAIKSKLIKNGSHTKTQVDAMSNPDLYAMIFSSGFSTAQQVTEISGRGVGMSMVKDCVDAIGGQIVIDSNPGKGASFQLELPIPKSVLIASCLGVRIGTRRFSLVQDDILRVLQYDTNQSKEFIQSLEQSEFLVFEGELVPIASLNTLLKLSQIDISIQGVRKLVVMRSGQDNRRIAVEVTEILDVEDMVIKAMHATLNSTSYYRGVTFLDDGGVGLILSTVGILDALNISRDRAKPQNLLESGRQEDLLNKNKILRHALTVKIGDSGTFALPQERVFRIEEVDSQLLKESGSSQVIPYRGSVLRVSHLGSLISRNIVPFQPSLARRARLQLVVVKNEDTFFGLEVEEVLDMVSFSDLKTELAQETLSIDGHIFIGEKTITLLNVDNLLESLSSNKNLRTNEDTYEENQEAA